MAKHREGSEVAYDSGAESVTSVSSDEVVKEAFNDKPRGKPVQESEKVSRKRKRLSRPQSLDNTAKSSPAKEQSSTKDRRKLVNIVYSSSSDYNSEDGGSKHFDRGKRSTLENQLASTHQKSLKRKRRNRKSRSKLMKSKTLSLLAPLHKGGNDTVNPLAYKQLKLKQDHAHRPIWVLPTGQIYLESNSKFYKQAYDFLVAISEPVSRPRYVHEYRLTPHSLYAAVSISLDVETILNVLEKLSKISIPENIKKFVRECTMNFGKAKLVLKQNRMYIEAADVDTLDTLLNDNVIAAAFIPSSDNPASILNSTSTKAVASKFQKSEAAVEHQSFLDQYNLIEIDENGEEKEFDTDIAYLTSLQSEGAPRAKPEATPIGGNVQERADKFPTDVRSGNDDKLDPRSKTDRSYDESKEETQSNSLAPTERTGHSKSMDEAVNQESASASSQLTAIDEKSISRKGNSCVYSFEILPSQVEHVQRAALRIEYPLMEEYDFRRDSINDSLAIEMKTTTTIRPYQSKSLTKMFGNGRARSGLIVLPCGAGKTLTGILACCTIKKSCIVLCSSVVAVNQWKEQFLAFTTIRKERICCFSSRDKDELPLSGASVLLTTYSMMAASGKRSAETASILASISSQEWGLLILDEVHVVPARLFRRVLTKVKAHCKLGLTATLVREDGLILDLNFLIGPKLYEANWLDLTRDGYIANVLCNEVWCPMTPEFFSEYLEEQNRNTKHLLYVLNPNKCLACDYLVRHHEARGDKILIFCDNIFAIEILHKYLKRPYIYGKTSEKERMQKLSQFRKSHVSNTLIISKVGDIAIDLPEATVLIQVSSHFGSRRQEAQRLGRILRPKSDQRIGTYDEDEPRFNAFFYSLVSSDTKETYYSAKRRRYLINNGYTFRIVTNISQIAFASAQSDPSLLNTGLTKLANKKEQLSLLSKILSAGKGSSSLQATDGNETLSSEVSSNESGSESESESESESDSKSESDINSEASVPENAPLPLPPVRRSNISMADLSGAGSLQYVEYQRGEEEKSTSTL